MNELDVKTENLKRLAYLQSKAYDNYLFLNQINPNDYINDEVMEEKDYEEYVELFKETYGYCFECSQKNCEEGDCIYLDYLKGKNNE